MLSTQQILQSLIDMPANAQQALPVLPNNGNPRGAFNMPHQGTPVPTTPVAKQPGNTGIVPPHMRRPEISLAERYPWLKPSASMDNIRNYLNGRRRIFSAPTPVEPVDRPISLPVMPLRAMEM